MDIKATSIVVSTQAQTNDPTLIFVSTNTARFPWYSNLLWAIVTHNLLVKKSKKYVTSIQKFNTTFGLDSTISILSYENFYYHHTF